MAVKVKFNPKIAAKQFTKKITKATNNKVLAGDIGEFLVERVKFQARRGKPLNDDGKFPKLKPATIASRQRKRGRKHQAFSPRKSNLTITGQLQDAIAFKRRRGGLFEIFVDKTRRSERKAPTNQKLAEFLDKIGFTLFTAKGLKRDKKIARRMKQILLRFLRRSLKST